MSQNESGLFKEIATLLEEVAQFSPSSEGELEPFRIRFLGSKNVLKDFFARMKDIAPEDRKAFGQRLNEVKLAAEEKYNNLKETLSGGPAGVVEIPDLTRPGRPVFKGSRHPVSLVKNRLTEIFSRIGFAVAEGPEIEDDYHNFSALNFPPDHPSRDMQDTFFIQKDPDFLLRTHTSTVQIRLMETQKPPIRAIMPGRVFRNETISARSHCFFHQMEGLYIDKGVSFADLKQTMLYFAREMFGPETKIKLRPSYFPFTEPSAEMDVTCFLCSGKGCPVCKHSGWVEVLGCGMVDPNVLENCGIDPEEYSGYAFGLGIDRLAMLQYRITDIRIMSENDLRFLTQFHQEV